ncbi:MAG: monovalent cation:proton antiporter-2 (CPA2) family protein [Xanthomonadales bacterium]|jgi:monovalent cation:proton antiporter-2 (CPA2) family protein|nr:monovalent cation:proton antiporter-2 (CPA2) family protein [Xanthomonadales bacterium]
MFSEFFLQAFVYLLAAIVAVPLARRFGLGSALGYILAGVIIGPYLLGFVGDEGQDVMHFAEFGVVLMLFLVGLELEPPVLWRMRVPILGMGGSQVLVSTVVIGAVALAFGLPWQTALAIGLILSLSSTAIVLQTMKEKGWMGTQSGRGSFSVLLFQDVAVIPILAILPFLALPELAGQGAAAAEAGVHGAAHDRPGWLQALLVLAIVAGIVFAGRFLLRPVFRWIAETRSQELFMATALVLIFGITLAMEFVDLSPALGTFLAGVVLAESEFRHELEANIEPFKGLLLGVFFIAVGASINFALLAEEPALILTLVATLIVLKLIVLLAIGRVFRLKLADNLMFAFLLAQGGEFAFLLFSFATQNRVLDTELASLLIVVVVLTMIATPLLIIVYERLIQPRFADCVSAPAEDEAIDTDSSPVIVAGYGRFGQIVSRLMHADGIDTTLLDHDSGQIELSGRFGYKVFYGDASRVQLLQAAGAEEARLLVIAIDDRDKAVQMVVSAKQFFPQLKVLARAYDRTHAYELMKAGAEVVTRETFGSALVMGEQALRLLGYGEAHAYRIMRTFKKHDEESLQKLYEVWGDDHAYGLRLRQNLEDLEKVLRDDNKESDEPFSAAFRHMQQRVERIDP